MYIPPEFTVTDPETIDTFLHRHTFGTLTARAADGRMAASHLPFLFTKTGETRIFRAHIALANELSRLADGTEVLLVFAGEHGYISSSWYGHPNVPTWNYTAVHVYGTIRRQSPEDLYAQLRELTRTYEQTVNGTTDPETMPQRMIQGYLQHIAGFEITAHRTEAAFKLSQNRNAKDFAAIVEQLDVYHPALAEEMKKAYPRSGE